ncbi:MAG: sugar transferase [Actinobacteria bacterium]|uniref:Unannotated protein n=1 Tax=freshwater metagenome TaxID=449393 RepID=A0A6J6TE14_9ZZZZ|nr:sugar transferase [Actinomycetota bacterium]MSW79158.1 sugar transferase [Actinomycetota bacterium]MSX54414.1 sugar transferase [Actinomycetota bacterium]MSX94695.1 sugar transferase [Actinomycetota bacterium]MSZ84609.1 sugar transferase [Actinomycetota bacterium]
MSRAARSIKWAIDVTVGIVASLLTLPMVVVLALGSAWSLRAWPFFVQTRVGRGHRSVRVVKLRSLPTSVGAELDKYELRDLSTTRFGHFLRHTHLDELPQMWSVASGVMSLVGPRPEMHRLAARFSPEQRSARDTFRPGCIGLWQASVHRGGLMYETPEYDLAYARHASLTLDIYIIWRMAGVLVGRDALQLRELPQRFAGGVADSGHTFETEPIAR